MARVEIRTENQVKRNHQLNEFVLSLKDYDLALLSKRPNTKSWSVLEVIEHMNIAHEAYREKIDTALKKLENSSHSQELIKASAIPSFLIKRFPPKKGKIKFKMKTFKRFQPVFDSEKITSAEAEEIFAKFQKSIEHIANTLALYPSKKVTDIKFPSAIGVTVKFNVAEACEFVICHNERHVQQIVNTLKKLRNA